MQKGQWGFAQAMGWSFLVISITWGALASAEIHRHLSSLPGCEGSLLGGLQSQDSTDRWMAMMAQIAERPNVLSREQWVGWLRALQHEKMVNPFAQGEQTMEGQIWGRILSFMIQDPGLNIQRIAEHARDVLKTTVGESETRADVIESVKSVYRAARFVDSGFRVKDLDLPKPPGAQIGDDWDDYVIEMMDTPVTQWMWSEMMGENPSAAISDGLPVQVGKKKVVMQGNHPVENTKPYRVVEFVTNLNQTNSASRKMRRVFPTSQNGDIYSIGNPKFYNFIVVRNGLQNNGGLIRDIYKSLEDYAWFSENAEGSTQEVATLRPLMINGHPVYDLLGNASEFGVEGWIPHSRGPREDLRMSAFEFGQSYLMPRMNYDYVLVKSKDYHLNWTPLDMGLRLIRMRKPRGTK